MRFFAFASTTTPTLPPPLRKPHPTYRNGPGGLDSLRQTDEWYKMWLWVRSPFDTSSLPLPLLLKPPHSNASAFSCLPLTLRPSPSRVCSYPPLCYCGSIPLLDRCYSYNITGYHSLEDCTITGQMLKRECCIYYRLQPSSIRILRWAQGVFFRRPLIPLPRVLECRLRELPH